LNVYKWFLLHWIEFSIDLVFNRPVSASSQFYADFSTLDENFDNIEEKFTYTIYGLKWSSETKELESVDKMKFSCLIKVFLIKNGRYTFLAWSGPLGLKGLSISWDKRYATEFVKYLASLNCSEAELNTLPVVERSSIRRNFSPPAPVNGNYILWISLS
jgi:hypothetical protein